MTLDKLAHTTKFPQLPNEHHHQYLVHDIIVRIRRNNTCEDLRSLLDTEIVKKFYSSWPSSSSFFFLIFPIFTFIFFCSILSSSSFPSPSPLHFIPAFLLFFLLVICWFISTHPTRLLTLFHCDEYGKDQDKPLDGNDQALLEIHPHGWRVQNGVFSHISPVFCACPSVTTRMPHLIFSTGRKPFAPPHFCSKSQPCGLRTKFLGVEKGSLGRGESNVLSLKFLSEEIIWKVWFLGRAWDSILGWFSTCLWGTW